MEFIFDAFSIDGFGDEHFDIVIVDCGGDKNVIAYASEKCMGADKLSIIGVEKLLPLIVWNKTQLQAGEEVVAAFDEACYKVACDEKNVMKYIGKARKGKENISLDTSDFGCLYYFDVGKMKGGVDDTKALQEKDAEIEKLAEEKDNLAETLSTKEESLTTLQKQLHEAKEKISALIEEKAQWEKDHPKPSNLVEQMVKVVEECKNSVDDLYGDLYIKGNMPKRKLESTIELFLKKFDNIKFDRNEIVALYLPHGDGRTDKPFNTLMICEEYFCVDKCFDLTHDEWFKDRVSEERGGAIFYWKDLIHAYHYDYMDLDYNEDWKQYYTCFKFNTTDDEYGIKVYENNIVIINKFLIPLFNKLKEVDMME